MSSNQDRSELVHKARENAHRIVDRLHHYEDDLARVTPGDVRGGEALREAVESAQRLAQLLENSPDGQSAPDGESSSS